MEKTDDTLTVFLRGEIDHHTARDMRERIDREVDRTRPQRLLLNMAGITFMDSSGIGLIMGRYRLMQAMRGTLTLVQLTEPIDRLIRLAGLDKLPIREDNRKDDTQ